MEFALSESQQNAQDWVLLCNRYARIFDFQHLILRWQSSGPRNQALIIEFSYNAHMGFMRQKYKHLIITVKQLEFIVTIWLLGWVSFQFRQPQLSLYCFQITTYACTGDAIKWGSVFTINWDFFKENVHPNFRFPREKTATREQLPGCYFFKLNPSLCWLKKRSELHTSLTVSFKVTRRSFMLVFESHVWTFVSDS